MWKASKFPGPIVWRIEARLVTITLGPARFQFPDADTANFAQERVKLSSQLHQPLLLLLLLSLSLFLFAILATIYPRFENPDTSKVRKGEACRLFREQTPPLPSPPFLSVACSCAHSLAKRNQAELVVSRVPRDPLAFLAIHRSVLERFRACGHGGKAGIN